MEPVATPIQAPCPFCGISDDTPKMTFACQHVGHTACFLHRVPNDIVSCPTCQTVVYSYAYQDTQNATSSVSNIQELYREDFDFKKNVLTYVRSLREYSKADKVMKKFMKERKGMYSEELRLMKERLKEIKDYEVKRLRTSDQFKTYKKSERKVTQLLRNLHPTKHFSARELRRALKGKPKLKSWPSKYRSHIRGDMYRYFYYRINI